MTIRSIDFKDFVVGKLDVKSVSHCLNDRRDVVKFIVRSECRGCVWSNHYVVFVSAPEGLKVGPG